MRPAWVEDQCLGQEAIHNGFHGCKACSLPGFAGAAGDEKDHGRRPLFHDLVASIRHHNNLAEGQELSTIAVYDLPGKVCWQFELTAIR